MSTQTLDCGHAPDAGHPYTDHTGKTVQGWTFVDLDGRKVCHACADKRILSCGHTPSPHSHISTGTAHTPDGREICCECADKEQREELKDRSKPFGAYLSGDGKTITTWTGGKLMSVVSATPVKLTRRSFTHGDSIEAIRARDIHGGMWHGRGSRGMCITMRPAKG